MAIQSMTGGPAWQTIAPRPGLTPRPTRMPPQRLPPDGAADIDPGLTGMPDFQPPLKYMGQPVGIDPMQNGSQRPPIMFNPGEPPQGGPEEYKKLLDDMQNQNGGGAKPLNMPPAMPGQTPIRGLPMGFQTPQPSSMMDRAGAMDARPAALTGPRTFTEGNMPPQVQQMLERGAAPAEIKALLNDPMAAGGGGIQAQAQTASMGPQAFSMPGAASDPMNAPAAFRPPQTLSERPTRGGGLASLLSGKPGALPPSAMTGTAPPASYLQGMRGELEAGRPRRMVEGRDWFSSRKPRPPQAQAPPQIRPPQRDPMEPGPSMGAKPKKPGAVGVKLSKGARTAPTTKSSAYDF